MQNSSQPTLEALCSEVAAADPAARWQMLAGAAIATGGEAKCPDTANTWDAQVFALNILGITAFDVRADRCVAIWLDAARRHCEGLAQLPAALAALNGSGNHSISDLLGHCEVVRTMSPDPVMVEAAKRVRAVLLKAQAMPAKAVAA